MGDSYDDYEIEHAIKSAAQEHEAREKLIQKAEHHVQILKMVYQATDDDDASAIIKALIFVLEEQFDLGVYDDR